ncbi:MAG: CDP-alcohol phosphatidyltransferase family protein [Gammaproteobacteria bacterium]
MAGWNGIANLPNLLSCFRFLAAPLLLYLAWHGYPRAYVAVLVLSFVSDALDGFLARWFHQESELGSMLDTAADVVIYITIPISAWWLWPELLRQEAPFVILVIASYSVPALFGLLKFRALTSYHTWAVKLAAAAAGGAALVMFAGGPTWPFRLATPLCVLAALEQIAITLVLPESWSDVRSLWHVLRQLGSAR